MRLLKVLLHYLLAPLPLPQHPTLAAPGLHLRWRLGWMKGWIFRWGWKLQEWRGGTRVVVGERFSLQGTIRFRGPGTVVLGDDVIVDGECTPFTHASGALIRIGSRTFLNGTRFGCVMLISVGSDCIIADARIMDTDFHALHRGRNSVSANAKEAPVLIGDNVWVAAGSMILKGVAVGSDAVIACGSVVTQSIPAGRIAAGNPARDFANVPDDPSLPTESSQSAL